MDFQEPPLWLEAQWLVNGRSEKIWVEPLRYYVTAELSNGRLFYKTNSVEPYDEYRDRNLMCSQDQSPTGEQNFKKTVETR